jgi:thiol peroxidase
MSRQGNAVVLLAVFVLIGSGCAGLKPDIPVDAGSVSPGTQVTLRGTPHKLLGNPVALGETLPSVALVDAMTMKPVDLSRERGSVLFVSIVPSVDTKVCEAQTHYLGEQGDRLPSTVRRITLSRDLPFAQKRFAEEAKLTDIQYLSDYREGAFGRATGLLVEGSMLLARSVIIVDRTGKIRYIQVLPEMANLPDMERAFREATEMAKQ